MGEINSKYLEVVGSVLSFVFSWLVLMAVAVILSGKFLMKLLRFSTESKQLFRLSFKIFVLEASGGEVVLGLAGFLITLFLVACGWGHMVFDIVKNNFGIDTSQFNSVMFFSSLMTVLWSFLVYAANFLYLRMQPSFVNDEEVYERQLNKLSRKSEDSE